METEKTMGKTEENNKLFSGVLWLNVKALGLVMGVLCGLAIFIATNWLVIKGGKPLGPHLGLLRQFFFGYRVSFWGSFVGFAYGFAVGCLCGAFIAWVYNKITHMRH